MPSTSSRDIACNVRDWPGIFIVGAPRSGTTLLRLMLDSHPRLAIPPETHFLRELLLRDKRKAVSAEEMLDVVLGTARWRDYGLSKDELKQSLHSCSPFSISSGVRAFFRLYSSRFGKTLWGDKTPEHGLIMTQINELFPGSKFIHIVRDGRDVFLSIRSTWFGKNISVYRHAKWWSQYVGSVDKFGQTCENYLRLKYEDLVLDPVATLEQICTFSSLDYTNELLNYHQRANNRLLELRSYQVSSGLRISKSERLSIHRRTDLPPDKSRVCRWKTEMSDTESSRYIRAASHELLRLGYSLDR